MLFGGPLASHRFFPVLMLVFFLAILAFSHFPYGALRMTYDSYNYMEGGKSPDTYLTEKNPDGAPYIVQAPLFHFYLGLFQNKMLACWWLNMLCFITSLLLIFRIGSSMNLPDFLSYACVVATAMNYPWLQNHFFVWTEPLFSVLIFLLIVSLTERKPLLVIISLCVVLFFLRKAGIFLIIGTASYYLLTKDFGRFLILGLITAIVIVGWELFATWKAGAPVSLNTLKYLSGLERSHYGDVLTSWVMPRFLPLYWRIAIAASLLIIAKLVYRKEVTVLFREHKIQVLFILFFVYVSGILVLTGAPEYGEAERFLSVMLPLVVLILFSFLNVVRHTSMAKQKLFYSAISLWALYTLMRTISHFL